MRKRKRIQRRSSTGKGWTTRRKEKALAKLGLSTGSPESSGEGGKLLRWFPNSLLDRGLRRYRVSLQILGVGQLLSRPVRDSHE